MRHLLATATALLTTASVFASDGATLNQWQSLQPSGPDNAVGGTAWLGYVGDGGKGFFSSGFFGRYFRRDAADQPWQLFVPQLDGEDIFFLGLFIAHPNTPGVITGIAERSGSRYSVARSFDDGLTWTSLLDTAQTNFLNDLAVAPSDPNVIYINVRKSGFQKSTDGGQTWTVVNATPPSGLNDVNVDPADPNTLYALNSQTIVVSNDGGATFNVSDNGVPPAIFFMDDIAIDYSSPGVVYTGSGNTGIVFRSTDGAANWTEIRLPSELNRGPVGNVTVDPNDSSRIFASTGLSNFRGRLVVSNDTGATWANVDDFEAFGGVSNLYFAADGSSLGTGSAGIMTTDGVSMQRSNRGFGDFLFSRLRPAPSAAGTKFYGSGNGYVATNPALPLWENRSSVDVPVVSSLFVDPLDSERVFGTANGDVLRSMDGTRSWTSVGVPNVLVAGLAGSGFDGDILHAHDGETTYTSSDGGLSWAPGTVFGDLAAAEPLRLFTASIVTPSMALLGTRNDGIYATLDTGQTWATLAVPLAGDPLVDIEFDHKHAERFYVATESALWRTDDSGSTWSEIALPVGEIGILTSIVVDPVVNGRIFIADNFQVQARDPRDGNWRRLSLHPSSPGGIQILGERVTGNPTLSGRLYYNLTSINQIQYDTDDDGVGDDVDNCILIINTNQVDADGDGIGNACDADIAPATNDCFVNVADLGALRSAFLAAPGDDNWNPAADFNVDGAINVIDLGILRAAFFKRPGFSSQATICQ